MSLSKVLEEIKKVKPFAEENVDEGPTETLSGRRGRKRQAQESLKRLRREYTEELRRSSLFIIATGGSREEFTKIATETYHCFSADPEALYKDLASRIPESVYKGKEGLSHIFEILGRHLEDKAGEIGILGYPQLIFKQEYRKVINSSEEFAQLVKQAINEQVGAEIVGINAAHLLTDEAISKDHAGKVTPIVLTTGDAKLAQDLAAALTRLTPRVAVVVAGKGTKALKDLDETVSLKEPTTENVEQALTTIRNSFKK